MFTAIGTTCGTGDGSTTFNLPDRRGRVIAGQGEMGGSTTNRLTEQSGDFDGDVLGDTGGSETHALTEAEGPAHDHGGAGGHARTVLTEIVGYAAAAGSIEVFDTNASGNVGDGRRQFGLEP